MEFVAKQKRAPPPGPVSSGAPLKPIFTALSVQAGKKIIDENGAGTKIDWFD